MEHFKYSIKQILGQGNKRVFDNVKDDMMFKAERFDYGIMAFAMTLLYLISMVYGPVLILKIWMIPLFLVASPLHFFIELPEHLGCDFETRDPFDNTRTIAGSRISTWFTNGNNFHVEHHLAPALSMDQLAELFEATRGKHKFLSQSYPEFYGSLAVNCLFKKKATVSGNVEEAI
jgi:fatty acid desaturase